MRCDVRLRPMAMLSHLVGVSGFAETPHTVHAQDSSFHDLLARLKSKDTTIDFAVLPLGLTRSADCAPYGSDADVYRDSLRADLERRDFRRVLTQAHSALAIDDLHVRIHALRAYVAEEHGAGCSGICSRGPCRVTMTSGNAPVAPPIFVARPARRPCRLTRACNCQSALERPRAWRIVESILLWRRRRNPGVRLVGFGSRALQLMRKSVRRQLTGLSFRTPL